LYFLFPIDWMCCRVSHSSRRNSLLLDKDKCCTEVFQIRISRWIRNRIRKKVIYETGPKWGRLMIKARGQKFSCHCPFRVL
jgi:hypothetical protein